MYWEGLAMEIVIDPHSTLSRSEIGRFLGQDRVHLLSTIPSNNSGIDLL